MNILVVFAHPNPESFNGAICQQVCSQLQAQGHQVELLDLYREGFDPCMSCSEREVYMDRNTNTQTVELYVKQLQSAEALVMIYPTWWMGPPAILKGWFDRVWLPHVVTEFGNGGLSGKLTNIKKIMIITTQGTAKWRMHLFMNPPKLMMQASLKFCTRCRNIEWLALYSMSRKSGKDRRKFLNRINQKITRCF